MPNLFNERLELSRRIARERGLAALPDKALLDMITRPVVRRRIGPELNTQRDYKAEYQGIKIGAACNNIFGSACEIDNDPDDERYELFYP